MKCDIYGVFQVPFKYAGLREWDNSKEVELERATPAYNYTTDEEWDGWEAREMLLTCADAMEVPIAGPPSSNSPRTMPSAETPLYL